MKKIETLISPSRLDEVQAALVAEGVHGLTISEVQGPRNDTGHTGYYRGVAFADGFSPKVKLELVVQDENARRVVDALQLAAATGDAGEETIWITGVEGAVRIRTNVRGEKAL